MSLIIVLNDEETYTDLDGCKIIDVPEFVEEEEVQAYIDGDYETDEGETLEPTVRLEFPHGLLKPDECDLIAKALAHLPGDEDEGRRAARIVLKLPGLRDQLSL